MKPDRNDDFYAVFGALRLAALAWAVAGSVLWLVEVSSQGHVGHGHTYLIVWSGARVFLSLAAPFLASGALFGLLLILFRRVPDRARGRAILFTIGLAGVGAFLRGAFLAQLLRIWGRRHDRLGRPPL